MERWRNIKLLKGGKLHLNIDMLKEIKRKDQWVIRHETNKSVHGKNSNEKMKNKREKVLAVNVTVKVLIYLII